MPLRPEGVTYAWSPRAADLFFALQPRATVGRFRTSGERYAGSKEKTPPDDRIQGMRSTAEIAADLDRLLCGIEPLPKIPEEELARLSRDCQGIPTEVTKRPLTNPWGKILLALNDQTEGPAESGSSNPVKSHE